MTVLLETYPDYDLGFASEVLESRSSPVLVDFALLADGGFDFASKLFKEGVRRVDLIEPAVMDDNHVDCLGWLRLLGDLAAFGIVIVWSAEWSRVDDLHRLHHLPPPQPRSDAERAWLEAWQPLLLIERRGPGFRSVHDKRQAETYRFVLDAPDEIDAADALRVPQDEQGSLVALFDNEGLVFRRNGRAVWLATPMPRWPVYAREA